VIKAQPSNIHALYKRGNSYDKMNNIGQAIQDYSQVIQMDPSHFNALYARAACYVKLENFDDAMADYAMVNFGFVMKILLEILSQYFSRRSVIVCYSIAIESPIESRLI
jgi:hypothetical protein